jgi:hypothetical protein
MATTPTTDRLAAKLFVFAGAGVSIPCGLPRFDTLRDRTLADLRMMPYFFGGPKRSVDEASTPPTNRTHSQPFQRKSLGDTHNRRTFTLPGPFAGDRHPLYLVFSSEPPRHRAS